MPKDWDTSYASAPSINQMVRQQPDDDVRWDLRQQRERQRDPAQHGNHQAQHAHLERIRVLAAPSQRRALLVNPPTKRLYPLVSNTNSSCTNYSSFFTGNFAKTRDQVKRDQVSRSHLAECESSWRWGNEIATRENGSELRTRETRARVREKNNRGMIANSSGADATSSSDNTIYTVSPDSILISSSHKNTLPSLLKLLFLWWTGKGRCGLRNKLLK